jgi:hypothetical protein
LSKVELVVAAAAPDDMLAGGDGCAALPGKGGNCCLEHPKKDICWGIGVGMVGIGPCKAELEASCMTSKMVAWGLRPMERMVGPLHLPWVPVLNVAGEKNKQVHVRTQDTDQAHGWEML